MHWQALIAHFILHFIGAPGSLGQLSTKCPIKCAMKSHTKRRTSPVTHRTRHTSRSNPPAQPRLMRKSGVAAGPDPIHLPGIVRPSLPHLPPAGVSPAIFHRLLEPHRCGYGSGRCPPHQTPGKWHWRQFQAIGGRWPVVYPQSMRRKSNLRSGA